MPGGEVKKKPYSDRRWYDDPCAKSPPCCACKHYKGFLPGDPEHTLVCDAFPKEIPEKYIGAFSNERDLDAECNNGIKFEWDGTPYD